MSAPVEGGGGPRRNLFEDADRMKREWDRKLADINAQLSRYGARLTDVRSDGIITTYTAKVRRVAKELSSRDPSELLAMVIVAAGVRDGKKQG